MEATVFPSANSDVTSKEDIHGSFSQSLCSTSVKWYGLNAKLKWNECLSEKNKKKLHYFVRGHIHEQLLLFAFQYKSNIGDTTFQVLIF